MTTLTVDPTDDLAEITATVRRATGTATVDIVRLAIGIQALPPSQTVYKGVPFNMTYRVSNEGDATLTSIAVTDDSGTGATVPVCDGLTLAPDASTTCQRSITLSGSTTIHAHVTGQGPGGGTVTDDHSVQMTTISPSLKLISRPNPLIVGEHTPNTLIYKVSNTGDAVLTSITIVDDNGGGSNTTICTIPTLQPGAAKHCARPFSTDKAVTITATATGQDPLGGDVSDQNQTHVLVGELVYLPYVVQRY
jgi:hypothetical protein